MSYTTAPQSDQRTAPQADRQSHPQGDRPTPSQSGRRSGRTGIIAVLIVALVLAGATRDWARSLRGDSTEAIAGGAAGAGGQSLANMNSFALALLLGGLRGPLVMFLWTQSETLKNEKNLEDFDTYVEWIRLLQPEFDTVHIFQVWNKAYNISVQMASWANKYTTVLDALDYAERVLAQRPNNVNMLYNIGSIYFDKLGSSTEKEYYKQRVRDETRARAAATSAADAQGAKKAGGGGSGGAGGSDDPARRRLRLDPVLDADGKLLPEMVRPRHGKPAGVADGAEWNNGAPLQYLQRYEPFPYGMSALALGYNFQKRAQVLQDTAQLKHANLSEVVVDSRPALTLKGWSEDEWERGRRIEMRLHDIPVPAERRDMEFVTARLGFSDKAAQHRPLIEEAIHSYDLSARLVDDALLEYQRTLRNHSLNLSTYQSHMNELRAHQALVRGDADYLRAAIAGSPEQRKSLLASAAEHYRKAVSENIGIVLRYYSTDEPNAGVFEAGFTREDVGRMTPEQRTATYLRLRNWLKPLEHDPHTDDRSDYERYAQRAQLRLQQIEGELKG